MPQKKLKRCLCVHACEHHKWAPIHIALNPVVHEHTLRIQEKCHSIKEDRKEKHYVSAPFVQFKDQLADVSKSSSE